MLFLEQKYFLGDHNLNYTDKMSMASGVEVRVPFLDPDPVQFAAGPGQVDLEKSHGRPAAAVDYLPTQDRLWRAYTPLVDDALSARGVSLTRPRLPSSFAMIARAGSTARTIFLHCFVWSFGAGCLSIERRRLEPVAARAGCKCACQ